ncbi:PIN domain-containing protein [Luteolibacter arcticus]|uniref:Ribonuclease VapC n=1 Tax=Luteolibacter arcticus TaxID=1581411 RepID=A0ABT3GPX4_9BACT|nr:PIN domain-containing protein [Luteolibacter arcticus]MCW1925570.1 PIN domain-containing protein [Luteolibacter arcticus]
MSAFPDTSFLYAVYRTQDNSSRADIWMLARSDPLPVSSLLLLEFRQSVRFQTRLFSLDRKKGYPAAEGTRMLRDLQSDLAAGILQVTSADWADVHRIAQSLSAKHTEAGGHRLNDILHVATALHLGAAEFLTFDANQKKLAEAEGMAVPL